VRSMFSPGEVARILAANPKTVSRWWRNGRLRAVTTPGGHHRIPAEALIELLYASGIDEPTARAMLEGADE
jgi:excisionase family DNA binding protein